ncbi:hypothetical protein M758_5G127300 [Ceratodon purpureus]|nr:hypothetical protein M758_5G127300 [Ceratodon purpureus]
MTITLRLRPGICAIATPTPAPSRTSLRLPCCSWSPSLRSLGLSARSHIQAVAMGHNDPAPSTPAPTPTPLRILMCGDEFPPAEFHTRESLQRYPHLHVDSWPREEVPDRIAEYDICVPRMMRIDEAVIARAKRLRLIVQFGVGLEGVDIDAATRAGIKVARIPSANTGNAFSCAEHCIYMTLGLLRHQKEMALSIAARRLGEPAGGTLYGKTVFILGYGHIGKELAPRLRCFGVHILAVRRSWTGLDVSDSNSCREGLQNGASDGDESVHEKGGIEQTLEFASRADIVITCCTLNPSTKGIVDKAFLSAMKKGAYLVNVARGGLLDYDAVLAALKSGHLGGLAIDVAWSEPFDPSDPILQFPNVLITPHIAGVTTHSYQNMGKIIADSAHQLSIGMPTPDIEFAN